MEVWGVTGPGLTSRDAKGGSVDSRWRCRILVNLGNVLTSKDIWGLCVDSWRI